MMKIEWSARCTLHPEILSSMQQAADRTLTCEGVSLPCTVSVTLCDDETIAQMNETFRGLARATDVLSFPSVSWPAGKTAGLCPDRLRREYDDETEACFLGDLFISVPHAKAQATEYGHSEMRETVYLLVHGICHLMGYDHIVEEDQKKMRSMEEKILSFI